MLDPAYAAERRDPADSLLAPRLYKRYRLRLLLGLGLLLVVDGRQDPRVRGDPLTLGDTELKEFDNDRGETIRQCRQHYYDERENGLTP